MEPFGPSDVFAATPPLESLKYIISRCASAQHRQRPHRILSIDVSRAYFYAESIRPVFIQIPAEYLLPPPHLRALNISSVGVPLLNAGNGPIGSFLLTSAEPISTLSR